MKLSCLITGSYSLSCILPITIGTVFYRRNLSSSTIVYQMILSRWTNRSQHHHDGQKNVFLQIIKWLILRYYNFLAPPSYVDLKKSKQNYKDFSNDQDDYFSLYTYVSDYVPPPPYSKVINILFRKFQ